MPGDDRESALHDRSSPAERRMLQVLARSWLIPGAVKNAVRHEVARGRAGFALGIMALWQMAFYGAAAMLLLALVGR